VFIVRLVHIQHSRRQRIELLVHGSHKHRHAEIRVPREQVIVVRIAEGEAGNVRSCKRRGYTGVAETLKLREVSKRKHLEEGELILIAHRRRWWSLSE